MRIASKWLEVIKLFETIKGKVGSEKTHSYKDMAEISDLRGMFRSYCTRGTEYTDLSLEGVLDLSQSVGSLI